MLLGQWLFTGHTTNDQKWVRSNNSKGSSLSHVSIFNALVVQLADASAPYVPYFCPAQSSRPARECARKFSRTKRRDARGRLSVLRKMRDYSYSTSTTTVQDSLLLSLQHLLHYRKHNFQKRTNIPWGRCFTQQMRLPLELQSFWYTSCTENYHVHQLFWFKIETLRLFQVYTIYFVVLSSRTKGVFINSGYSELENSFKMNAFIQ